MTIKNALVVDDSKSARIVLKRMLNELDLDVDTVESAKDAIDYLLDHRPDVIFMDHMMPGMDGFEAVKHIKNNADTAVIPIMMFTSRGGDVYLSQARALGAVGIIPKTISPVGLKEALFKLGLVKDRRIDSTLKVEKERRKPRQVDLKWVNESTLNNSSVNKSSNLQNANSQQVEESLIKKQNEHDSYIDDLRKLMDDQTIELHKSMWLGIESVSHEIFNRLNTELEEQFKKLRPSEPKVVNEEETPTDHTISWPWLLIGALLISSIILNITLLFNTHQHDETTMDNVAVQVDNVDDVQDNKENIEDNLQAVKAFIKWAQNREIEYPYNELALNENRLSSIETLIQKAVNAGYSGSIILQTHVGRFCLSRDENGDYNLADESLIVSQCEYIGNPMQPSDAPATHQSLSFANYLSDLSILDVKDIKVEVTNVSRMVESPKYPQVKSKAKAEEWNLAARLNNRITVKLNPATVSSGVGTDGAYYQ